MVITDPLILLRLEVLIIFIIAYMRINFDDFPSEQQDDRELGCAKTEPIRIELESGLEQHVSALISPNNYHNQIQEFNSFGMMPSINEFLTQQVEKEIRESRSQSKGHEGARTHLQTDLSSCDHRNYEVGNESGPADSKTMQRKKQILQYELGTKVKGHPRNPPQLNQKFDWVYKYKKHSCAQNFPTKAMCSSQQSNQVTHQPYLKPNKYNRKICEDRKLNSYMIATFQRYNVYQKLYQHAQTRELRRNIHTDLQLEEETGKKPKLNSNYLKKHLKDYIPLEKRTHTILEHRQCKIKQRIGTDYRTGRKLFEPDLTGSKESYRRLAQAVPAIKIAAPAKKVQANDLIKHIRNNRKRDKALDLTTIDYFAQSFYPSNSIAQTWALRDTESPLLTLKKQELQILKPFLHEVEEAETKGFELQTNLSSVNSKIMNPKDCQMIGKEVFKEKLAKYYQGLTLHDREILREETRKLRRAKAKGCKEESSETNPTYRPSINIRSASLDSISDRHNQQLYYI